MAVGSDARLASIAREELELADDAPPERIAAIARRWIDAAARQRGRSADSLLLHARDLLTVAENRSDGLARLERQKEIQKLDETLPDDLVPLPPLPAVTAGGGAATAGAVASAARGSTRNAAPSATAAAGEDTATLGALGRLSLDGQDLGVVMRYQTDMPLPRSAVDKILDQLDKPHREVQMEFHAAFILDQPTTLLIQVAGPIDAEGNRTLAIDRMPVELRQGTTAATASIDLPAGLHRVLWQVSGGQFEPCRLTVRNDRDGSPVHLRHDAATRAIVERLPVKLRVGFSLR